MWTFILFRGCGIKILLLVLELLKTKNINEMRRIVNFGPKPGNLEITSNL